MKNGRVNERNIGNHKLDGGAKTPKTPKAICETNTDEYYRAKESVRLCNMILKDGIRIYDNIPVLVLHWINKGIAQVKEIENPWTYGRKINATIKIAYLNKNHRKEIELVKDLLTTYYKLKD